MFRTLRRGAGPRACVGALTLAACTAHGAPADAAAGLESLLDVQVESASRYAQSTFDAPASVHTGTREESAGLGHTTMGDMLSRMPGLYIATDRDYGQIGLRGLERPGDWGSRLLVTVDGLRVNDPMYGQALPGTEFPVVAEWIKRLEYVPGPGGSVYGNNALFGVVNAVTLDGADAPGLRLRAGAGSFGGRRAVAQFGRQNGGTDVFLGLAASRSKGEALELPEFGSAADPLGRSGLHDAEHYVAAILKLRHGPWQWLSTATVRRQDVVTAPFGTSFGQAGWYRDSAAYHQLGWDGGWSGDLRPSVRLMHGYGGFAGHYPYGSTLNVDDTVARWIGLDARLQWRGWTNHMVIVGLEATRVYDASLRNFDRNPDRSVLDREVRAHDAGLFVQDAWRLTENLSLTSGLRLDRLALGETRVSPRLAMVLRPDPQQALKLSAGRAYRAPVLAERYYEDGGVSQVTNPQLGTERIQTLQASWERALDASTLLTLSVYRNGMRDLIELRELDSGAWRYENIGSTRSQGLEIDVVHRTESQWQWRASLARQQASAGGRPLTNTPRWVAKGHLITPVVQRWQGAVEADVLSSRRGEARVAGYVSWNANLSYRLAPEQRVSLRVLNAGDVRASDPAALDNPMLRVPRPRRAVWLDWQAAF